MAGSNIVHLHGRDNVAVAIQPLPAGTQVRSNGHAITLLESIRPGHKLALSAVAPGREVRKYGEIIGFATREIPAGGWVHSHNVELTDFARDYAPASAIPAPPKPIVGRTFMGYRRPSGKAGTRNYVAIISSVNCSATVSKIVARKFAGEALQAFPNVDGVIALTHAGGCGMQWNGLQHNILNRTLGGLARHANIGGYLLIGLGCEQGTIGHLMSQMNMVQLNGAAHAGLPPVLSMQDEGGTAATVAAAERIVREQLLPRANAMRREPIAASEIVLATKCGGSDGNSGITANPAVGVAVDMLVACGGTAILAETTEIYGAEHLLTRRARSPEVAAKLVERIAWWKWYAGMLGATIDGNPSVGNKEGGLTTIAEKSLGAVAKGGSTVLNEVYEYAEEVTTKGLVVMDTPGFDPVCVTGMVAGGANVTVFTTGRGSCFGCKPTPSIKIATNSLMYERMRPDMDLNAGGILEGRSVAEVGAEIFEEILAVASGQPTKSEKLGYGDEEFAPWMVGPTL